MPTAPLKRFFIDCAYWLIPLIIIRIYLVLSADQWVDEIFIQHILSLPLEEALNVANTNLYPLLVKICSTGSDESILWASRGISFIFWLGTIFFMYLFAEATALPKRSIAFGIAIFPPYFTFALLGRGYMMATCFLAIAIWALWSKTKVRWVWAAIAFGASFMSHNSTSLVIVIIMIYALYVKQINFKTAVKISILSLILFSPGLALLPRQYAASEYYRHTNYISEPIYQYFSYTLCPIKIHRVLTFTQLTIFSVAMLLCVRKKSPYLILWVISILVYIGLDHIYPAIMTPRHSFFGGLFLIPAWLSCLEGIKKRKLLTCCLLGALFLSTWQFERQAPYRTGAWEAAAIIDSKYQEGDVVLLVDSFDAADIGRRWKNKNWYTDDSPLYHVGVHYFDKKHLVATEKDLLSLADNNKRVWVLLPHRDPKKKKEMNLSFSHKKRQQRFEFSGGWQETRVLELWQQDITHQSGH